METTDTHIFTNKNGPTLSERLNLILKNHTQFFDVIVGYFYFTGFYKIYKSLKNVKQIRILIGMDIDNDIKNILPFNEKSTISKTVNRLKSRIKKEFEQTEEEKSIEEGVEKFLEYLKTGKLKIRAYPGRSLHSKVYIMLKEEGSEDLGKVITGSSNFTYPGLEKNLEFNVELKDAPDVRFAEKEFEELWKESVDVEDIVASVIKKDTFMNDTITPYQLYLKTLYEYFGDLIHYNIEEGKLPPKFKRLQYQLDAVKQAELKLNTHNGVFLADVVGLGKTYIAAMLARELKSIGDPLIISPPVLKPYWEQTMKDFGIPASTVISNSTSSLEKTLEEEDLSKFGIVFIDEAHKFRNSDTKTYGFLHQICAGKKVVLISATPLNNTPSDIASQIYLFENKYSSTIPDMPNLKSFFGRLERDYEKAKGEYKETGSPESYKEFIKVSKRVASEMRNKVLKHLIIRRTRSDVKEFYGEDLKKQGLSFPVIEKPRILYYKLDKETNRLFDKTVKLIETARSKKTTDKLFFARYQPLNYLKEDGWAYLHEKYDLQKTDRIQRKKSESLLVGLLKVLLVKRLDSSFESFKHTLDNIVKSCENMEAMLDNGTVYISKKLNVFNFLSNKDLDELDRYVEELGEKFEGLKVPSEYFEKRFKDNLQKDIIKLKNLKAEWDKIEEDPKIDTLIERLENDPILSKEKIIIFTEFEDTEKYLMKALKERKPKIAQRVLPISHSSKKAAMEKLISNFDPNARKQEDDLRILISTEVLAEGLNLNRAKAVVNYDIPWNPTRVIQRFGRINRVGTKGSIYIYNFFPTEKAENEMHLKAAAITKMEMFVKALGADAQYLTKDITINPKGIFEILNSTKTYEQDEGIDEELQYLRYIRDIEANSPDLYEKIKKIPEKARTSRKNGKDGVITYFKLGNLSKFIISSKGEVAKELTPIEAFAILKAEKDTPKQKLPEFFYEFYKKNKEKLNGILRDKATDNKRGGGNEAQLLKVVKALSNIPNITKPQREYINTLLKAMRIGTVADALIKIAFKKQKKFKTPKEKIDALISVINSYYLKEKLKTNIAESNKRIILSEALTKGEEE